MSDDDPQQRQPGSSSDTSATAWLTSLVGVGLLAAAAYARSVPGIIPAGLMTVPLSLVVLTACFARSPAGRRNSTSTSSKLGRWRQRLTIGALALTPFVALTGCAGLPLSARFLVAQPRFDTFRATIEPVDRSEGWTPIETPQRIGGYTLSGGSQCGDVVLLEETHGYDNRPAGFAYLPSGPSSLHTSGCTRTVSLDRLSGHWYAWISGS